MAFRGAVENEAGIASIQSLLILLYSNKVFKEVEQLLTRKSVFSTVSYRNQELGTKN
ncbi:MAG: hypothetical protein MI674_07330 [Cytophagales bacterium]|nr:hypothetical protein [Cytophagales bacterium]